MSNSENTTEMNKLIVRTLKKIGEIKEPWKIAYIAGVVDGMAAKNEAEKEAQ